MGSYMYVYKGDDKSWTLDVNDSNGNPVDITGWTFFFTVKTNKTDADADAIISKDITTHTNPTEGLSTLVLTESDTDVTAKKYWYDISYKDASNKIKTFGVGIFEVKQDVTRRTN